MPTESQGLAWQIGVWDRISQIYATRSTRGSSRSLTVSTMWGNGPYQNITETISDIHALVIERLAPQPGIRWLDLACGTGAIAELAARAGASVTGVGLAPALIETARQRAQEQALEIDYRVGDCERLDLDDAAYDRLSSTCGIMFAPDHTATAHELARVVAPGGRIALANWTPDGGVGQMFTMMSPFLPTPPPGAGSPFAWGREEVERELLGDEFELDIEERISTVNVPTAEDYWQLFSSSYGPTMTTAEALNEDRRNHFHQTWVDFFDSHYRSDDGVSHPREYLLVVGTRR